MRIFNTLTGQKEVFTPMVPGRVGFYVCGITPYDMCHLGHARTYVTFDVIARYLRATDLHVELVKNFTDVDDKIINKANKEGVPASEISERYIKEYELDMAALGIQQPTEAPRVTTHIKEIIALIEKLISEGAAYAVAGDVYFEVKKFPDYLKLSKRSKDDLEARVESDERKRDPADFALWKGAKPDEPFWPSPFGNGRPGWHIECSAMALKYLGETFDLHGGGRDLIFPHHENEIAQSEAATHHPFAKIWMHAGMLNIDNEKMSKSLGNFFTIREILRSTSGEALRAFFLNAQYRGPMSFDITYSCPRCRASIDRDTAESLSHADCGKTFSKEEARQGVAFASVDEADKRLTYVYKTLRRADEFTERRRTDARPGAQPEPHRKRLVRLRRGHGRRFQHDHRALEPEPGAQLLERAAR